LGLKNACFAQLLAVNVPKQIRLTDRPNWKNASATASNQYGENGFALMPSAILEVAFHTNRSDGAALMQESFRVAVANGIRDALNSFFKNPKC
jgi:N-acetylmuramoyl-L-alanine amidase